MLSLSLAAAVALLGVSDPDAPMATAPATPIPLEGAQAAEAGSPAAAVQQAPAHGLSTDEQIARWIDARDPAETPFTADAPRLADDRRMHGEFGVAVGTGGYRDYSAAVSAPVGDSGRIDFSWRQVENGYPRYGYGDYGLDYPGYVFPGYAPGAAAEHEFRIGRRAPPYGADAGRRY